jgi:DNA polymerase III sliding clamp (beta) subunit (PCNA family)
MKFVIDGKKLSEKLKAVLLKGRWNQGTELRTSSLGSAVIIQVVENEIYLYNGNESTYVKIKIDADVEILETGRCCISYDLLNKYIKTGNV